MKPRRSLVVGLDIGTTKVCAVVAAQRETGIEILGLGAHPNKGLRKGVVINFDSTVEAIKGAVQEAQITSGYDITNVFAGISGGHIKSFNSHGMIPLKGREITQKDVDRALDAAGAVAIPKDREILHILPYEFRVDDQRGIRNPVGMSGMRLEVNCHIITGASSSTDNIYKCCERVNLTVDGTIFDPLASALAVLTEEEMETGAVVLDIGGGTSDIAVYHDGAVIYSGVLPLGGRHITKDIAHGLSVPPAPVAENLKRKHGWCLSAEIDPVETVVIEEFSGEQRHYSRQILCEIIEQRCDEILRLIHQELDAAGIYANQHPILVLTGGTALMPGLDRLAAHIFGTQVRIGLPRNVTGQENMVADPAFAGAVGLAMHGRLMLKKGESHAHRSGGAGRLIWRVRDWFKDLI